MVIINKNCVFLDLVAVDNEKISLAVDLLEDGVCVFGRMGSDLDGLLSTYHKIINIDGM
jgi:hypothetical protein